MEIMGIFFPKMWGHFLWSICSIFWVIIEVVFQANALGICSVSHLVLLLYHGLCLEIKIQSSGKDDYNLCFLGIKSLLPTPTNLPSRFLDGEFSAKILAMTFSFVIFNIVLNDEFSSMGFLVGWVLWHINFCNAKSIFIQIKSSISNNSV